METKSIEPIKISGKTGEEVKEIVFGQNIIDKNLNKWRRKRKLPKLVDEKKLKKLLIKKKIIDKNGNDTISFKKIEDKIKLDVSDVGIINRDGKLSVYKKIIKSEVSGKVLLEYSEDNTALYEKHKYETKGYAGNRLYIINKKIVSGWSLYYSPHCLMSPERYDKNIDMIYNVPYIYASFEIKAQLGLGADFKMVDPENEESKMEKYSNWYLKKKLKMNTNFRKKVDFHLSAYGNTYVHLGRDEDGIVSKFTILQPERMKLYLDPMTSKILFYIYLPPILGGTMIMSYPSLSGMSSALQPALSFPTPVIIPVNNIIHLKNGAYTEYPFGFSDLKSGIDVAQARFDVNLLAPYYFKKYCKATYVAGYEGEERNAGRIAKKLDNMKDEFEGLEPGSDIIHGPGWKITTLNPATGQSELFNLTSDLDQQLFAIIGTPETYFKPKGATDRMFADTDKIFMAKQTQKRNMFGEIIMDRVLRPAINLKFKKTKLETAMGGISERDVEADKNWAEPQPIEDYEDEFKYPKFEWIELAKKDETQDIANTISLLNNGVISPDRAAKKVGEKPPSEDEQLQEFQQQIQEGMKVDKEKEDMQRMKDKGQVTDIPKNSEKIISPMGAKKKAPNAKPKKPLAPPTPKPTFHDEFSDFEFEGETILVKVEE